MARMDRSLDPNSGIGTASTATNTGNRGRAISAIFDFKIGARSSEGVGMTRGTALAAPTTSLTSVSASGEPRTISETTLKASSNAIKTAMKNLKGRAFCLER